MRNLKRALSLALALVMVLSMMVVGAGAVSIDDFTDADEIVNTEAVTTMVSLGVIDGNDDGSYNPTGIVKRGEMAKLIAVMLNGGKEPTLGQMTATFSDTVGHWAQNYITYVANLGIIDGRGDGTFAPNDDVTGSEAAKMILTALGYRSEIEGFTGANWAINVQLKANDIKLFDGLTINPDEGLSRDNTAQMLYNAVQAQEVEYRNLEGNYDGVIYPTNLGTVLENRFNVRKVEGVVEATSLLSLDNTGTTVEGKTRLTQIVYNGEEWGEYKTDNNGDRVWVWDEITYPVEMDTDLLGQRVVIYVRGLNDLAPNASGMEVIGTVITSDDNTVVTTSGRLKDPDAVKDALRDAGLSMPSGGAKGVQVTAQDTTWGNDTGIEDVPGVEQTFIDNNADGRVDVVIQKTPALALVNTYNTSSEKLNLSGIGSIDFNDIQNPEDVAADDHVLVYNYEGTYVLAQAESVTGTVTAFNNNSSADWMSSVTVDGSDYIEGAGKLLATDLLSLDYGTMKEMVDGTYTLYLDPHGYVLGYVEDESAAGNYAVITGVNATGHTSGFYAVEVKLIMADGSTGKYDVNLAASYKKWNGTNNGSTSAKEQAMYETLTGDMNHNGSIDAGETSKVDTLVTYSLDGSTVTLGQAGAESGTRYNRTTGTGLELTNTVSRYTFNVGPLMTDDKTVFFIKDTKADGSHSYTAVQGLANLRAKELTTVGTSQAIYYKPAGTTSVLEGRAVFATVNEEYTSNSNYAFVTGNYTKTTSGTETIYTYPVVFENGETGTLSAKDDASVGKNLVHEYQLDGEYVNFDVNENLVVNSKIVTSVGTNAVSFANANNINQGIVSYPSRGAQVWNVEDSSNVFSTNLRKNDLVGLVLDDDGNIVTAFVYDRQDDDMTKALTGTGLSMTGEPAIDANGGAYEWNNVVAGDAATLNLQLGASQSATVEVKSDNVKGTVSTGKTTYAVNSSINLPIYTATTTAEVGGKITVTVTVEDTDTKLLDRVIVYEVTVNAAVAGASEVTVNQGGSQEFATADLKLNGTAYATSSNDTLVAGKTNVIDAVNFKTGIKNTLSFTLAGLDGATVKSATLADTGAANANTTETSGTSTCKVVFTQAGTYNMTLSVTTQDANAKDTTIDYDLTINVTQAAAPTTGTIAWSLDTTSGNAVITSASNASTVDVAFAETGAKIQLNMSGATATNVKVTNIETTNGLAGAASTSSPIDVKSSAATVYTVDAADGGKTGTITLTVEFSNANETAQTATYTINLSCAKAKAPAPTMAALKYNKGSDSGVMTSGVIDFTNPTPTVNFTTTAASSSSDRSIEFGLTPAAGTTVEVVAPTNTTWNKNTNVLTIAKEMTADFTITVRVSGDAYSTAEYTVTINLDAT